MEIGEWVTVIALGTPAENKQTPVTSVRIKNWYTDISLNVLVISHSRNTSYLVSVYINLHFIKYTHAHLI